jgi:hypothetical protein
MHRHCEILIPATDDVEGAVSAVMAKFNEGTDDREPGAFWDWYVIGGRFAGNKLLAKYDKAKLDAFYDWLHAEKVTVSGLQCGKQELSPPSQREKVDAKWNEMFPSAQADAPCPLFAHSNDQYGRAGNGTLPDDVLKVGDVPERLRMERVIIAGRGYNSESRDWTGELEAKFMLASDAWNGCNHMPVKWDGSLADALAQYRESLSSCKPEYAAQSNPTDDWLAVTVDYHS